MIPIDELLIGIPDWDTVSAINLLKLKLAEYDYISSKIATGCATREEYVDQIAYCESLRRKIRELEGS